MEHKFHNHSLRKNSLIDDELKLVLSKIEKQKKEKLSLIKTKRDDFKRLQSRQCVERRSLDSEGECILPHSFTSIKTIELMRNSKRFSSEPDLFAKRNHSFERKQTFPFVEANKCLSYRKLKVHGNNSLRNLNGSPSLDSGIETYGTPSTMSSFSDSAEDVLKISSSSQSNSYHSSPTLAFPIIGHHDLKHKVSPAKLCFTKTMGDRVTSKDGWKYLMTNVFKRLSESSYHHGQKEEENVHHLGMNDVALCRYLRMPIKHQVGNECNDGDSE